LLLRRALLSVLLPYTTLFRSPVDFDLLAALDAVLVQPADHRFEIFEIVLPAGLRPTECLLLIGPEPDLFHAQLRAFFAGGQGEGDRKSTRLNSSHVKISYAVF